MLKLGLIYATARLDPRYGRLDACYGGGLIHATGTARLDSSYGDAGFMLRLIHITRRLDSCCEEASFILRGSLIRVRGMLES